MPKTYFQHVMHMVGVLLLCAGVASAKTSSRVLVIAAYHPAFSTFFHQVNGIKSVLDSDSIVIDVEFMDTKRFPGQENVTSFVSRLEFKLSRSVPYDIVMVCDDNALRFVLSDHGKILQGIPVVFLGINNKDFALEQNSNESVTGVVEAVSMEETIRLALNLQPGVDTIWAIADGLPSAKGDLKTFFDQKPLFRNIVLEHINLDSLRWEELSEKLKHLSHNSAVLLLSAYKDKTGDVRLFSQGLEIITESLSVPLYHLYLHGIGSGVLGGKIISHYEQGREAAGIVKRVLSGTPIKSIPVVESSPNKYMFDYNEIKKFGLDLDVLPEGSEVINKPVSYFQKFKFYILTTLATLFTLSLALTISIVNIVRRKKVEEQLRYDKARYYEMIANISDVIAVVGADNAVVYQSPNVKKVLGWEYQEVLGTQCFDFIHLDDHAYAASILLKVISSKNTEYKAELRLKCKNGDYKYIAISLINKISDPMIQGILVNYHDITDRKIATSELEKVRKYLSTVVNSMPSWLIGVDKEGVITQWNNCVATDTDITDINAVGQSIFTLMPDLQISDKHISNALHNGQVEYILNQQYDNNGVAGVRDITLYPVSFDEFQEVVIRVDDISEKKNLEERLPQSAKMDGVGNLAGGVAHDFNNMLTGILGAAELLKKPGRDFEKQQTFVNVIIKAAYQAAELTGKLLAFERKSTIDKQVINTASVIEESLVILSRTLDKKVSIQKSLAASNHCILAERSSIQNVFINLAINAGYAMKNGGLLTISTSNIHLSESDSRASIFDVTPGEYLKIDVADTGEGMPQELIGRVFEPFFTTKPSGEGTGLGLAAVYSSVVDHKGAIWVESTEGVGTTFTLLFPLTTGEDYKKDDEEYLHKGTGHVLLIDDEELLRETGKQLLEDLGYVVEVASNGREGISKYRQNFEKISVVLLDMLMPDLNGLEVFEELKKINPNCNVIIVSGYLGKVSVSELEKEGIKAFIQKPYTQSALSSLLKKYSE